MHIILGSLIIILGLLMGYSASRYKASEIQADIDGRTEERLASIEVADELVVDTDGRRVTLRGMAASEADKELIIENAEEVWGALSPVDEIELLEVAAPYELSVVKEESGQAILKGVVPSEAARLLLIEKAEETLGGDVDSELTLAAGVPDGDWTGAVAQGMQGLASLNHGRLNVVDSTIELTGEAPGSEDVDRIETLLKVETPEGFAWAGALDVEKPVVSPFTFAVSKADDAWQIEGYAPDEAAREQLLSEIQTAAGDAEVNADIQLADGMPGDDWQGFVQERLPALQSVNAGTLRFEDYDVQLDGTVATPDDAEEASTKVAGIDPKIQTEFEALDPTVGAFLDLRLSPDDGVTVNGALPSGLSKAEAVELLGLKAGHDGEISEDARGDVGAWQQDLAAIGGHLPAFETVELSLKDGRAMIEGETYVESDAQQVVETLSDDLDERWQPELLIEPTENTYADGTRRANPLSGTDEEYRDGAWLSVAMIEAEHKALEQQKAGALEELRGYQEKINLAKSSLSGRNATLDAREREIRKADERLTALKGDVEAAEAEIDRLDLAIAERGDADGELTEVESKLAGLRSEQATKLAILGTLAGKIESQRSLAEQDHQGLMTLRSGMETTERHLGERQADIERAEEKLVGLAAKTDQSEERLTVIQQEIEASKAALDLGQGELEQVESSLTSLRKERSEIQTMMAGLAQDRDNDTAALEQRIEAGEQRLAEIDATATDYERRADEAKQRLAANDQKANDLQEKITTLKYDEEKIRIMVDGLRARHAEQKQVEADLDGLRVETEAAVKERDEQVRLLEEQRRQVMDVEARLAEKEAEFSSLNQEQATRLGLLGSLNAKLERQRGLSDEYTETEARFAALMSNVETASGALADRQEAIKEAEQRLASLSSDIGNAEGRIQTLKADGKKVTSTVEQRQASLSETEEQLAALQAKLETAGDAEEEKAKRLAAIQSELADADQALKVMQSQGTALEGKLTGLAEKIEEREAALAAAEQAKAKADSDLDTLQVKLTSAETSLAARMDEQSKAVDEKKLVEAELQKVQAALEETRTANAEATREAETIEASIGELTTAIDAKRVEEQTAASEVQSLRDESEKVETALADNRTELEGLIEERRKLRDAIEEAKTDIAAATTTAYDVDPLLTASPVQTDDGVRIAHLLFNYSSAQLSPGAERKVEEAAMWIKANHVEAIRLVGYADAMGSSANNHTLSQARAETTAGMLADLGIDPDAIEIEAVGDNVLIQATADQVSEPLNRSVGIFVKE